MSDVKRRRGQSRRCEIQLKFRSSRRRAFFALMAGLSGCVLAAGSQLVVFE